MTDEFEIYDPDGVKSPGDILDETLEDLEISKIEFLRKADIDAEYFWSFLKGDAPLSDELAERLAKWTKVPAWLWQEYENRYQRFIQRREDFDASEEH